MDSIYDTEVVFTESFAAKPVRTLVVNTNAPLHSINTNIEPSSGVCTFPPDSQFPDRFILWRAIGQKLFLEERSLCRTIVDGTLCLDFSRTPILPGTSIALFEENILCIVVPTQSTVHRFYARLLFDPTEMINKEVSSIFTQIIEKEFLVDNHTFYQLTTNGHAFRSSVILQPDLSRIAYCMTEGQMVVVTMYANKFDKVEEMTFREYGLMKRLLGEASSGGVSDVSGLTKVKSDQSSFEDMFYAVYHDGTLRAWNAETQRVHSLDVCKFDSTMDPDLNYLKSLYVKVYPVDCQVIVVVAVSTCKNTKFHFISDQHNKLAHLFTIVADSQSEALLDFGIVHKNSGSRSLWALWNSMSTTNEYFVKHIDIEIIPKLIGTWRKVCTYSLQDAVSDALTVPELRESIFNVDAHPFEIVSRSVQIACQGSRCEYAHGDWAALTSHVDSYLRSPEFDTNYAHRGSRAIKSSSSDSQSDAEHRFFLSLARTCDQLEIAARGPLGLFLLDMVGAVLTGVVQQDRFSIILCGDPKIVDEMESCSSEDMEKIVLVAAGRVVDKEDDGMGMDERENIDGPAHSCMPMRAQVIVKNWSSIVNTFIEEVDVPVIPTTSQPHLTNTFDGSFVHGLIASRLRHIVQQRLSIAQSLLAVIQLYREDSARFEYPIFDFPYLEEKLGDLISLYKLFDAHLSLKLMRNSAQISLCSWFMAERGVDLICEVAQVSLFDDDSSGPQFNDFFSVIVETALQFLSPNSPYALFARSLAIQDQYLALMTLCNSYGSFMPEELRPTVMFYKAIAFSGIGKPLKAMAAFNTAARGITDCNKSLLITLSSIDKKSLSDINLGVYYVVALRYLNNHRHSEEVIEMARNAVASLPPGHESTSTIYATLFNHLIGQGNWCDALMSIIQNTDPETKRMALGELIKRMLHVHDWKSIVELNYGKLEEEVEHNLLIAARAQEATTTPHLFKLLFSFYMKRNDFESAARAEYEYAFVLRTQAEQTPELLRRRRDALAVASTLLDLLPEADRFLSFPNELPKETNGDVELETATEITQHMIDATLHDVIADELNMASERNVVQRRMFILTAEKLCEEWVIANARVALLVTGEVPPCEPKEIVDKLIAIKNYDIAFDVCRQCDVSVCGLLSAATRESISIDADPPLILPNWIQANQRRAQKTGSSNHWSVVRGLLAAAGRLWPDDSRPLRAVTRTFLAHSIPVPCWLDAEYTERDVGSYLRCLIEYGAIAHGLKVAANCVDQETKKIKSIDSRVCLPLTAISDLLSLGIKQKEEKLLSCLNEKLRTHFTRVEGFEKAAQLSH